MTAKPTMLLPQAERDVDQTMEYYRLEGGSAPASRWSRAVEKALRHVATHPASGSARYAELLTLPGLRFWPLPHFPQLVFYVERGAQIDVWRVLHGSRDIPHWLSDED